MVDIVTALISYLTGIFAFFNILFSLFGIMLEVITNPYLFLVVLFTVANVYVCISAHTRKEIIIKYASFIKESIKGFYKVIQAAIPLAVGVVKAVAQIISGLESNTYVGAAVAVIIAAIILGSILMR